MEHQILYAVRKLDKMPSPPLYLSLELTGPTLHVEIRKVKLLTPENDPRPGKGSLDPLVGGVELAVVVREGLVGWNGPDGTVQIFVECLLGPDAQSLECQVIGIVEGG